MVFLCSLLEVHCQTAPYVSFMGLNLPNHAYVNLTSVGEDTSNPGNILRCHTDLSTCCSTDHGSHLGEWYFPDGSALRNASSGDDIYRHHEAQRVDLLHRNDATSPSGIYRCDVETIAVNDVNDDTITGETVYVGLYSPSEGIPIFVYSL